MKTNLVKENERVDDLELSGLKIIQNKDWFSFGVDAVLLSDIVEDCPNGKLLDLCTGNAIIPILLSKKANFGKIIGVEIQEQVAEMANRSIELNDLQDKITINCIDLKELPQDYYNKFDVVSVNPPYFKGRAGVVSDNSVKMNSRHEILCNLEDVFVATKKVLKNKGSLYMVHRANRIVDVFELARKHALEPKKIRFVSPDADSAPNLVLIKFIKGAGSELTIVKPLCVYNKDRSYSDEILDIYSKNNIDREEKRRQ